VGFIVAMTVLAAIGDISRFENAKKLVGYAGIGAGVHDSGKTHKEKKITKKGRRELRWATPHLRWVQVWWKRPGGQCGCRLFGRQNTKNTCSACANPIRRLW